MTFVQNTKIVRDVVFDTEWRVGEYNRLSKEDGDKPESDSIQNQHNINQAHIEYLRRQGENIVSVKVYSDDGFAGGTFDRPQYKAMIRDIEAGKINCIIFKDNSRLGRNYPELGKLMEEYFPQMGVRVISVLNNLDSVKDPRGYCSAIVSFSNIVNDDYIRQLSIKIKSTLAMKREKGEFTGNYAPFGYAKDPNNYHKLVVDPEAAQIVRMIFDWYESGMSVIGIVKKLNSLQITTPGEYKIQNGCKSFITYSKNHPQKKAWATSTVNTILKNEVYIGNMVQGKNKSVSYRSKKMVAADESEWSVVEGTHEPIISDQQFLNVHNRLLRSTHVPHNRETSYLLSGYIKCGQCGHTLTRNVSCGIPRYRCPTRTMAPNKCQAGSVKESVLEETILEALQKQIQELVDAKAVIDQARTDSSNGRKKNEYESAITKAEKEQERLIEAKFTLYDHFSKGILSEKDYQQFSKKYDDAIARLDEDIKSLRKCIADLKEARRLDDEFIAFFEKYGNIQKLDRDVLNSLVDHVVYNSPERIEIFFNFSAYCNKIHTLANVVSEGDSTG